MMSEQKHINWLAEQLPNWQQKELITNQQAQAIKAQYPETKSSYWARLLLSGFGGLVFGLGVILFFAYNWQDMHRLLKLFTIFSALLAANLSALYFDKKQNHSAAEGLSILGTVLFGAAIWLISQIYHIDEHYPNAFMLWGGAALLMAYARQSTLQNVAALFLLSIWGFLEMTEFRQRLHISPWIILFAVGGLFVHLRHQKLFSLCIFSFLLLFGLSVIDLFDRVEVFAIFSISIVLILFGLYITSFKQGQYALFRASFTIPGFTIYLACLYALSFKSGSVDIYEFIWIKGTIQNLVFWGSFIISIMLPILYLFQFYLSKQWQKSKQFPPETIHLVALTITAIWGFSLSFSPDSIPRILTMIVMNILFLTHCFAFIIHGSKIQKSWEVAIGCLLFALLVFTRYTDLFESLLIRSAIFLVLGAGIFFVGNFYQKQKPANNKKELT
jgi:uncharacterized membrane protein